MYLDASFRKKFPELTIDASLQAKKGEFVSILGPSGAGKSTLLQLIAGTIAPDFGRIAIDSENITSYPPEKRDFGVVFQEKLLFPNLNVLQNVQFGLRMHNRQLSGAKTILAQMGLKKFAKRKVSDLSGGEAQRVAIARAIAFNPKLLLLDEPLKEMDGVVKESIKNLIKKMQQSLGITAIYVTHDVEEAFSLSDRICMMDHGQIVQIGMPLDVFENPANSFVEKYFSPYFLTKQSRKYLLARKSSLLVKPRIK